MNDEQKAKLIEQAQTGIGAHDGNDWSLNPGGHISLLPDSGFVGLKNILSQTPALNLIEEYEQLDRTAGREQKQYRWKAKARIWLFFAALAVGAFSLLPLDQLTGWASATRFATFVQFLLIVFAVVLIFSSLYKGHYEAWRKARTAAELARGRLFRYIINADASSSVAAYTPIPADDLPLALQKLEYVRRYHIELQYAYYFGRGNEHIESEKNRRKWLFWAGTLGLLASLPLLITGVHLMHDYWGWFGTLASWLPDMQLSAGGTGAMFAKLFLALGTFAVGLEASLTNLARVNNDMANSNQYHETARRLAKTYKKWLRKTRWQAVDNDLNAVRRWFQLANGLILEEHRKWTQAQAAYLEPLTDIKELAKSG